MGTRKRKNKLTKKPWYEKEDTVSVFERGAKDKYPSLKSVQRTVDKYRWINYIATIDLEEYEQRKIKIRFKSDEGYPPKITVDGPEDSPHRYNGGRLCIWYPKDPLENRWVFDDGLLMLLKLIEYHLYREAWWRETGEWLGPEIKH